MNNLQRHLIYAFKDDIKHLCFISLHFKKQGQPLFATFCLFSKSQKCEILNATPLAVVALS